jgi:hypothetical protein
MPLHIGRGTDADFSFSGIIITLMAVSVLFASWDIRIWNVVITDTPTAESSACGCSVAFRGPSWDQYSVNDRNSLLRSYTITADCSLVASDEQRAQPCSLVLMNVAEWGLDKSRRPLIYFEVWRDGLFMENRVVTTL